MSLPDYKDAQIAALKEQIRLLRNDKAGRVRQFFINHFRATDRRWFTCCFAVEVEIGQIPPSSIKERMIDAGIVSVDGLSVLPGCKIHYRHYAGSNDRLECNATTDSQRVIFMQQNCCKLKSIPFALSWGRLVPGPNSTKMEGPAMGKAFYLPIIDHVIACDESNPPNLVKAPAIYKKAPKPEKEMVLPVNGIFWDLIQWDVTSIKLTSPDRTKIIMTIDDNDFPVTDEELLRVIY